MNSYDSDQRLILQGFSKSTTFAFFCTLESKWKKPWKTTPWTPHEKTPLQSVARAQEHRFQAALANMSTWYAHQLVTVYILYGQDDHLRQYRRDNTSGMLARTFTPNPRSGRGWPFF